ncbi:DUF3793 family protein [Terrisporobacter sp.]|uniref:DUF3793 family protein n=1 Tax=Terrisporobacter sp. TaxID=1965305 RepID=UPI002A80CC65|nr:DUF3793 family protein [Terrisporobacter sp.]MCI6459024.1 DUF3793 family protein [Clostridium sp.]MDY4734825.1 DUF3793 family protein [Terrisporobacter sp.]
MKLECNKKCCENKSNSLYIKRILEMLGAVILGSKPAEIINVPGSKEDKKIKLSQIEAFFSNCSRITYRIITTHDGGKRVLFINEKSMEKVLVNKRCINFLKFVGYSSDYELNDYMDELVFRLQSEEFPHEIGVFLGYPLKDVLGFMGYGKNELVEVKNWRIYGDKEISYEVYNNFMRDKAIMKEMIETMNINELRRVI